MTPLSPADMQKREAARAAIAYVEDGMTLGLGTGSTAAWFVTLLGERVQDGVRVRGVPTSDVTAALASKCGIEIASLDAVERLDLCVDGVDEVDPALRAIKGGGGALLREKIVAAASDRVVYIADASKNVTMLGAFPLPVEVVPMAARPVERRLQALGCPVTLRLSKTGQPFRTDEGNVIFDCGFGRIDDPEALADRLAHMPGVVEHGLFLDLIDAMIVAGPDGVHTAQRAGRP